MRVFAFVLGAVAGVFGVLIAQIWFSRLKATGQGPPAPAAAEAPVTAAGGSGEGGGRSGPDTSPEAAARHREELEAKLGDVRGRHLKDLAVALYEARFNRDWAAVEAVASLIADRSAEWVAPESAPPPAGPAAVEEKSLPVVHREVARRRERLAREARRNEATALAGKTDADSIGRLLELFERGPSPTVQEDAADALARSGDERAIAALVRALREATEKRRALAAAALGRAGYREGVKALREIARTDLDAARRREAVSLLASFDSMVRGGEEDPALKTALEVIREERDPEVRKAALAVLVDVDLAASRPALAALVEATKDADPVVRTQAVQVLHQHALKFEPPEGLVQALEGALDDETVAANRAGILTALRDLGDEGTLRVLDAYAGTVPGRSDARLVEAARDGIRDRVGLER